MSLFTSISPKPQPLSEPQHFRWCQIGLLVIPLIAFSGCGQPNTDQGNGETGTTTSESTPSNPSILTLSGAPNAAAEVTDAGSSSSQSTPTQPSVQDFNSAKHLSPMIADSPTGDLGAILIGDYRGIWPCHHCDTLRVDLNLLPDGSVIKTMTTMHQGKANTVTTALGHYQQKDNKILVTFDTLNAPQNNTHSNTLKTESYLIDQQQLILLKGEGHLSDQATASDAQEKVADLDYSLTRQ